MDGTRPKPNTFRPGLWKNDSEIIGVWHVRTSTEKDTKRPGAVQVEQLNIMSNRMQHLEPAKMQRYAALFFL